MYRVGLRIFPREQITVDELVLTFPFHKKTALSFSRYFTYDYESQRFDRAEVVESIGRTNRPVSFQFNPAVLIGNHVVGMEWVCETNAGWSNSDSGKAIQIIPIADAVILQVKVISRALYLSTPFVLSFALYPTPVKKLPDSWRQYLLLPAKTRVERLSLGNCNVFGI